MISTATQRGGPSIPRPIQQNQPQKSQGPRCLQHFGRQDDTHTGTHAGNTKCNWPRKMFSRLFSRQHEMHQPEQARQPDPWTIGLSDSALPPARTGRCHPLSWGHPTRVKELSPSRHRAFMRRSQFARDLANGNNISWHSNYWIHLNGCEASSVWRRHSHCR